MVRYVVLRAGAPVAGRSRVPDVGEQDSVEVEHAPLNDVAFQAGDEGDLVIITVTVRFVPGMRVSCGGSCRPLAVSASNMASTVCRLGCRDAGKVVRSMRCMDAETAANSA